MNLLDNPLSLILPYIAEEQAAQQSLCSARRYVISRRNCLKRHASTVLATSGVVLTCIVAPIMRDRS